MPNYRLITGIQQDDQEMHELIDKINEMEIDVPKTDKQEQTKKAHKQEKMFSDWMNRKQEGYGGIRVEEEFKTLVYVNDTHDRETANNLENILEFSLQYQDDYEFPFVTFAFIISGNQQDHLLNKLLAQVDIQPGDKYWNQKSTYYPDADTTCIEFTWSMQDVELNKLLSSLRSKDLIPETLALVLGKRKIEEHDQHHKSTEVNKKAKVSHTTHTTHTTHTIHNTYNTYNMQ